MAGVDDGGVAAGGQNANTDFGIALNRARHANSGFDLQLVSPCR
jgi:hypothetical protein